MKKIETTVDSKGVTWYRLTIRKRSPTNPNLRPKVKSNWFRTEDEANKQEKKLTLLLDKKLQTKEHEGVAWGKLIDQWEVHLNKAKDDADRGLTKPTAHNYVQTLRDYTNGWNKLPATEINQADVKDLYQKLWETNSRSMQEKVRTAINSVFKWGIQSRKIKGAPQSPTVGVAMIGRKEEKMPEILTILDIRKLLETAKELHPWYYIWAVALYTGMRNGELHALEWNAVNFHDKELYVHKAYNTKTRKTGPTKGTYWRTVPISEELDILLKEIRLSTGQATHVLPRFTDWDRGSQAKILRTFCEGVGIPSVKFHTLRACFATQLIRDGVAPGVVMSICGWKDLETMQIYIRRAGIEVRGATENLKLIDRRAAMGRVVELFKK